MRMNRIFTKKKQKLNIFLNEELKMIEREILLQKKSEEKTKRFLTDYSKSLSFNTEKSHFIVLN